MIDVLADIKEGIPFKHWLHEVVIAIMALIFILYKVSLAFKRDQAIFEIQEKVNLANQEIDYYKKQIGQYKSGVSGLLEQQFKIWGLTQSEADVALLLIKGLSMKEVAEARGSSESTVRQQSASIYKKSNLENRNQLASYFLEDIFN